VLVELPVRSAKGAVPSNARDAAPTDAIGQIIAVPELRGVCILAVDDDRDALALVREILEATGATVVTADSGLHAWNTIQRTKPDVLLTDLGMPHMTGFDLISKVRGADDPAIRSIPAAALTAYVRSEDRTRALRSGFQLHLSKPIEPAELMAAIASLAGR
jgi:CheY-like chemotaxis protein